MVALEGARPGGVALLMLKGDLRCHQSELLLHLMRLEVAANSDESFAGLLYLSSLEEMAWRVRHEGDQTDEHDDTPRNLQGEWKTPLELAVRCIIASKPNPVGHHDAAR